MDYLKALVWKSRQFTEGKRVLSTHDALYVHAMQEKKLGGHHEINKLSKDQFQFRKNFLVEISVREFS